MTSKIELGKFQELIVVKQTDFGVFLNTPTGAEQDKILLPKKPMYHKAHSLKMY